MKKEGSVRKKGNYTELRIWIDGKQKSFYGKSEAEARRKAREYRNSQNISNEKEFTKIDTFGEYVYKWLIKYKYGKIKDSSYDILERVYFNQLNNHYIASLKLNELTIENMQQYINDIDKKYSNSILKKVIEVISPPLKLAVIEGKILYNILDSVNIPRKNDIIDINKDPNEDFFYTEDEVNKIVKACMSGYGNNQRDNRRYRYAPCYVLLLNTGMRIGELTCLTWDDVDFDKKTIRINKTTSIVKNRDKNADNKKLYLITTPKTPNSNRYIPMNTSSETILRELKRRQMIEDINTKFVVSTPEGNMMLIRVMEQTFKRICDEHGVKSKGLHALRHTFGSMLLNKGVDIKVISKVLGHSTVKFTYDRYIHIINNMEAQAINLLNVTNVKIG